MRGVVDGAIPWMLECVKLPHPMMVVEEDYSKILQLSRSQISAKTSELVVVDEEEQLYVG